MKRTILTLLIILTAAFSAPAAFSDEAATAAGGMSAYEELELCIEKALERHPDLRRMRAQLEQSQAQLGRARSSFYPKIDFSSSYSAGASQPDRETRSSYSHSFSLRQYITDFGKTANTVKASRANLEATMCDMKSTEDSIVYAVKNAYYECVAAKHLVAANQEGYDAYLEHLEQAKAYFESGKKSKIDVTSAEVDLTNAHFKLLQAKNAYQLAVVKLYNAMGCLPERELTFEWQRPEEIYELDCTLESLLKTARDERPDMLRAEALLEAAKASARATAAGFAPSIYGSAGYGWADEHYPMDHSWHAGVSMSVTITDGNSTVYSVREARARVKEVEASNDRTWQNIAHEVESAYINMKNAEERLKVTDKSLEQAEENFYLAKSRYNVGVGSNLEFVDAQVSLLNARINKISAAMEYYISIAALEKAVGAELPSAERLKAMKNRAAEQKAVPAEDGEKPDTAEEQTDNEVKPGQTDNGEKPGAYEPSSPAAGGSHPDTSTLDKAGADAEDTEKTLEKQQ